MGDFTQTDIADYIDRFRKHSSGTDRYSSFDYCYSYFKTTPDLTRDIEKSCLALGFYLASWGMMRGSSFMLQKSAKHLEPTVRYIAKCPKSVWSIDADNYFEGENIHILLDVYKGIKKSLVLEGRSDLILVTKVMMGVFGSVPAFDSFFTGAFKKIFKGDGRKFTVFNETHLRGVAEFYSDNKIDIDEQSKQINLIDFITGKSTKVSYPKAKIIDMYGFSKEYYQKKK